MAFEDDARSLESAVARFISALLLRVIHCSIFRHTRPGAFPVAVELRRPTLRQTCRLVSRQIMGRVEASHSSAMLGIHRHCP
jgi:hypothetical protein